MGLREDIEAHVDSKRPAPKEELSKTRSEYGARAVVEAFYAGLEGRAMRPLDQEPASTTRANTRPDTKAETLLTTPSGIEIKRCAVDDRGIVDVVCTAPDFGFDNPVYIVNPPLLVEDENGTIEQVVGEDELGNPIVRKYREDPVEAMVQVLTDLKEGDA